MTAPPKWVKRGEPGHVEVMEPAGIYVRVSVFGSSGEFSHLDRLPVDKRTGGPKGYVLEGTFEAMRKQKKTHDWGGPVPVEGERLGHRCSKCKLQRDEKGAYAFYRRGSEPWQQSRLVPPCEVK